ncbi:hypothetical protein [Halorarius litoreus]|uniref:hypothetical protein n=1 Tax=Halorarius litoreus TaxID=2962676 RepID=UPI0020CB784D|nr:hypothetical protein [Halorarius litoreus]
MTALDAVCTDLRSRGYTIDRSADRGVPPAIARGGDAPTAFTNLSIAVEPVTGDPTTLVERAAHAARSDRAVLYVMGSETAAAVRDVLAEPRFVREERDGCRSFYHVPDRIRLGDGFACVRADGPQTWREDPPGELGDGETHPLVLLADGEPLAALDSVAALTCPSPDVTAFPYRYRRVDGTFRVERHDGREVGRYRTLRAMKANAYRPVPVPLVPEHHLQWGTPAMALAVVDGGIEYERYR